MRLMISDMAPATNRDAWELAAVHHNLTPNQMAASLPPEAVVADIGAGTSTFGDQIAKIRPDITWNNIDPCYGEGARTRVLPPKDAPPNVNYLVGDIVRDNDQFPLAPGSADRVYCSGLIPHLFMVSHEVGSAAIHNMTQLARPDGTISISGFDYRRAVQYDPDAFRVSPTGVIRAVEEAFALPRGLAFLQRVNNIGSWVLGRPFSVLDYVPSQPNY